MADFTELHLSREEARELFRSVEWESVRMLSFEEKEVTVLLRDNRRLHIRIEHADEAYEILSQVKRGDGQLPAE